MSGARRNELIGQNHEHHKRKGAGWRLIGMQQLRRGADAARKLTPRNNADGAESQSMGSGASPKQLGATPKRQDQVQAGAWFIFF
jgi:hypothetical protein